jgi:small subunit ribosomal protein S8
MSLSDPIADMLTRLRNGCKANLPEVMMPSSKLKVALATVMKQAGYVSDVRVVDEDGKKNLAVELKYRGGKRPVPVIEGLKRVSKPSCRIYVGSDEIPRVLGGLGVAILSTSQGVMTDRAARKANIGGEVLCYVW